MERAYYSKLLSWKNSDQRKPLILRGARQVGKTYLLKHFAKSEYQDYVYLNFDEEPHLKRKKSILFFQEKFSHEESLQILSRTSLRNFAHDGNIINYPLYAISLFPHLQ